MTPQTRVYGAAELKMAAHRYWIWGFGISLTLHIATVFGIHQSSFRDLHPPRLTFDPPVLVSVPGNIGVPTLTPAIPRAHPGRATPRLGTFEPVQDPPLSTDDPVLPRGGNGVEPGGTGIEGGGGGGGESVDGTVDDPSPEEFVPVEKLPMIIRRTEPVYPEMAARVGLTGKVWVKMLVDREGKVRKVLILKSDNDIFSEAVLEVARQWLFVPAVMNGGPVAVWVTVPFAFKLK